MAIWKLHEAVIIGWEMYMQKTVDIFLGYAVADRELCLEVMKRLK